MSVSTRKLVRSRLLAAVSYMFMRFLAIVFLNLTALAQVPTIEQSLNFRVPANPRISPDGRMVAYEVRGTNWDENAFETQVWVADLAAGERYQLTSSKKSSMAPEWSPDGKRIAFASDRDGKRQLYWISARGGEATALTTFDSGVGNYEWSPDGASIAFTSTGPEPKSRKDRHDKYGDFEIVQGDYLMSHLWIVKPPVEGSTEKPKPEQLTDGTKFSVSDFEWSPDSTRIAFAAARDPDLSSSGTRAIYTVRLLDKGITKLTTTSGPDGSPMWSPDGRQIAFITGDGHEFYFYKNNMIAIMDASGGQRRIVGADFDEDPQLVAWTAAGIYFGGAQKTDSHLFRLDPGTMAVTRISAPEHLNASGFSITPDHKRMVFAGAQPNQFTEIYWTETNQFEPHVVTNFSEQYKAYKLASREVIGWKSVDGTPIEGVLIKPADFDVKKKYPLLVVIHGGPTGVDRPTMGPDRYYPVERFAAKGAVILKVNYRGSAGYGEKFRSLNVRNLGLGDYQDVISGVDALIAKGFVDKDRVGAMGWSQGGYISAFITTYSDRFKAVSVGAGISDWTTYYVNTDIHPFTRQYLKATPWDDPEIYRRTSPISYIKTAKTPTLIQHGELDKRVPIPNAYELRQALEDKGVPVKLIVYKGFGHGIDKPKQQRAVMEHNYEWFSKWIWGEDAAAVAP